MGSLPYFSEAFPNRILFESLRDRHQGAGHADGNDEAPLVDRRVEGDVFPFIAMETQIAERLTASVQRRAMTQYISILAGQAKIGGVDLVASASPLLQRGSRGAPRSCC